MTIHEIPAYFGEREKKIRDDESSMDILWVRMQTSRLVDKTRSVSFTFYPSHIKFKLHVLFFLSSLILKYEKRNKKKEIRLKEDFFFSLGKEMGVIV
jgi:hypothetical protein